MINSGITLGFNFSEESFQAIKAANECPDTVNKISAVYGSSRDWHEISARPLYRFPKTATSENLFAYAKRFREIGVKFWFTSNAITIGSKTDFDVKELGNLTKKLCAANIGMIVADTLLLEYISKCRFKPYVELSTIMRIESPRQLIALKQQYPFIVKMVMHISYNRSFKLLKQFVKAGNHCGIEIEVLTNEACGTGYDQGATPCVHRDACYHCHGNNETLGDAKLLGSYPFNRCIGERYKSLSSWLNLFWILPEDFYRYRAIGINSFKLTGRTATNEFIEHVLPKYTSGVFNGNLLHIWKSIESINSSKTEELQNKAGEIDTRKLGTFLDAFENESIECHSRLCGIDCDYCEVYMESMS